MKVKQMLKKNNIIRYLLKNPVLLNGVFLFTILSWQACNNSADKKSAEIYKQYPVYKTSDLDPEELSPLQFLQALSDEKSNILYVGLYPNGVTDNNIDFTAIKKVPKNWIKPEHIDSLIIKFNDNTLTIPVFSVYADFAPKPGMHTTIGIEAMRMVEGYRNNMYPSLWPEYYAEDINSIALQDKKQELINWWRQNSNQIVEH